MTVADMIFLVHRERRELMDKIIGACEEQLQGYTDSNPCTEIKL